VERDSAQVLSTGGTHLFFGKTCCQCCPAFEPGTSLLDLSILPSILSARLLLLPFFTEPALRARLDLVSRIYLGLLTRRTFGG
jgi:hypothetical protein